MSAPAPQGANPVESAPDIVTLILRTVARGLTPLMVLFSVYLLMRGHDAVGGGFIGALAAGAAVVLHYFTYGPAGLHRVRVLRFAPLAGSGLAIAVAYGLAGLVLGGSFLHGGKLGVPVPLVGTVGVAASLVFDIGVYLVVVGMVVAAMTYLGERQS